MNLKNRLLDAACFWEPNRIIYNVTLTLLVLICWGREIIAGPPLDWVLALFFLLALALPGSVGTYVVAALTVIVGASQELGSPQFIAAFLYSFALVVLLQFRDLTFNPARLDRQVRAQIDHELADLHSEIGEMIANTRSMLKLKEKKE